jgi:hypothetical protein
VFGELVEGLFKWWYYYSATLRQDQGDIVLFHSKKERSKGAKSVFTTAYSLMVVHDSSFLCVLCAYTFVFLCG